MPRRIVAPKWSAKSETRKLDAYCRQVVLMRDGNRCRRCHKPAGQVQIHWAHIITRAAKSVRWDMMNSMALCAYHHRHYHHYPLQFAAFVLMELGTEDYDKLVKRSEERAPLTPVVTETWWQYLREQEAKLKQ